MRKDEKFVIMFRMNSYLSAVESPLGFSVNLGLDGSVESLPGAIVHNLQESLRNLGQRE